MHWAQNLTKTTVRCSGLVSLIPKNQSMSLPKFVTCLERTKYGYSYTSIYLSALHMPASPYCVLLLGQYQDNGYY